jgi:hypothetical protein
MWRHPIGVLVGQFLKQVERTHGYEPVGVLGKRGEFGDACRMLVNDSRRSLGARDRSMVAPGQKDTKLRHVSQYTPPRKIRLRYRRSLEFKSQCKLDLPLIVCQLLCDPACTRLRDFRERGQIT